MSLYYQENIFVHTPMSIYQAEKAIQLTTDLRNYLLQVGVREPALLKKLREQTVTMPERNMQILPEQGQFLSMLVKIVQPQKILEIGTYTGYSSLCMALTLPDVAITALDKNPEWTKIAQKYWEEAGVSSRIELKIGQALEHLPSFPDQYFDLIFIDADKRVSCQQTCVTSSNDFSMVKKTLKDPPYYEQNHHRRCGRAI